MGCLAFHFLDGAWRPWLRTALRAALGALLWCAASSVLAQAICAEVKIEIRQKLSLERQAFDAYMRISNGLEGTAVESLQVALTFLDANGNGVVATSDPNASGASFFIQAPTLSNVDAIDGTGRVAAKSTAEINWLIIPAAGAGGNLPQGRLYLIGAQVNYRIGEESKSVAVTPDTVMVRPQPLLELDYFLAGDVYADDPFTAPVEPSEPFTLGLRVKNTGGGTARSTSIESAQPRIVENRQGLAIGFQIADGYVNDLPAEKSLLLRLGDIAPGSSKVGRWNMTTTLAGRFVALDAQFTHADSLGGAVTSLISEVRTHLLLHDVKVDLPGRDGVRDFLGRDGDVLRVYESDGTDTAVIDHSNAASLVQEGNASRLQFPATLGFAYVRLSDPKGGLVPPGQIVRSDGRVLPAENVWRSKARNGDLSWSHYLNVFDANTPGSYVVSWQGAPRRGSISATVYRDTNANGIREAGEGGIGATSVLLTGTTASGQALSTVGYTDSAGLVRFVELHPGHYQLAVGLVQGLADGVATAGDAGGVPGVANIGDIQLAEGVDASGYLFAKLSQSTTTADLGMTASLDRSRATIGELVQLTLRVSNDGPGSASSSMATVQLPLGLDFVSNSAEGGTYSPESRQWMIGNLQAGAGATLRITMRVAGVGHLAISAETASSTQDPLPSNNRAAANVEAVGGDSKIQLGWQTSSNTLSGDGSTAVLLTINNHGPDPATDLSVKLDASGLTVLSAVPTRGGFDTAGGRWALTSLAAGESAHVLAQVRGLGGEASLAAALEAINAAPPARPATDRLLFNSSDCHCANLTTTIAPASKQAAVGESVEWTVTLGNRGPNPALGVAAQVVLSDTVQLVEASASIGAFDALSRRWTMPVLHSGQSAVLTVRARVLAATPALLSVLANSEGPATPAPIEVAPFDNEAVAHLNGGAATGQLRLVAATDRTLVTSGEEFTIEWRVSNEGAGSVSGVTVQARVPNGAEFVALTASQGNYDALSGYWNVGGLGATGQATLSLRLRAQNSAPLELAGLAFGDQIDTLPANDVAIVTMNRRETDVSLALAVDPPNVGVGQPARFIVTATNNGGQDAAGLVIAIPLPVQVSVLGVNPSVGSFVLGSGGWRIESLERGAQARLEIVFQLDQATELGLLARLHALNGFDLNPGNNEASITLSAAPRAVLSGTLQLSQSSYFQGDAVVVRANITNSGSGAANNLRVDYRVVDQSGQELRRATDPIAILAAGASTEVSHAFSTDGDAVGEYVVIVEATDDAGAVLAPLSAPYTLTPGGRITGSVYDDRDANGVMNGGDVGLSGVEVQLTGSDTRGAVNRNATSSVTGEYAFSGLLPGSYTLRVLAPAGFVASGTSVGSLGGAGDTSSISGISLGAGAEGSGYHFAQRSTESFSANLAATMASNRLDPLQGETVSVELVVVNNGPASATGTVVQLTVPAVLAVVAAQPQTGSYQEAGANWSIGDLPSGGSARLVLQVRSTGAGEAGLVATVSSSAPDVDLSNNTATLTLLVTPAADLGISLAASTSQPAQGEVVSLVVDVVNGGPALAAGAQVQMFIPAGAVLVAANPDAGSYDGATGLWRVGNLGTGASANLALSLRIDTSTAVAISGAATSQVVDAEMSNNSAALNLIPMPTADLQIALSSSKLDPNLGELIALRFDLTNPGPSDATGVRTSIALPPGLVVLSHEAGMGSFDAVTGNWSLPSLASGLAAQLTVNARVAGAGSMAVTASASSATLDPNGANNVASLTIAAVAIADVSIALNSDSAQPVPGQAFNLGVVIRNAGPASSVVSAVVSLPPGLALAEATASQGTYLAGSGNWTVGELASGAGATLNLRVTAQDSGGLTVAAQTASSVLDLNLANNSASLSINPIAVADLAVRAVAGNPRPNLGEPFNATLEVVNGGPSTAAQVAVQTRLPAGLQLLEATPNSGSFDQASGTWHIGELAPNALGSLAMKLKAVSAGALSTTATATSAVADPNPANNIATMTVNATAVADLALTLAANATQPKFGDVVALTVSIRNAGPHGALGVKAEAKLPSGLVLVNAIATAGSYDSATGIWTLGDLANAGAANLTIEARIATAAPVRVEAAVSATSEDPVAGNNLAQLMLTPVAADLGVALAADNVSPGVNETYVLRVELANRGPAVASAARGLLRLPAGTAVVSAVASPGSFSKSSGVWTVGDLPAEGRGSLDLTLRSSTGGAATVGMEVSSTTVDPQSANNTASLSFNVLARADLVVSLSSSPSRPKLGDTITLNVKASNSAGPQAAGAVTVTMPLPAGLALVSAAPSTGTYETTTGLWRIGDLAKGSSASLQVKAKVLGVEPASVVATISSVTPDPQSGNNLATIQVVPQPASDLAVRLSADSLRPQQTGELALKVEALNNGPSVASAVTVKFALPTGLEFVSAQEGVGSYSSSGTWTLGDLASGARATLVVVARVKGSKPLNLAATIKTATFDPDASNNSAALVLDPRPAADLALTVDANSLAPAYAATVVLKLRVVNSGPAAATAVRVASMLPSGLELLSATASAGSFDAATSRWSIGDLNKGGSATLKLNAKVLSTEPLRLRSEAATDTYEANLANNLAELLLQAPPAADLALGLETATTSPRAGEDFTLDLLARNAGPNAAESVRAVVRVPSGLTLLEATPSHGSFDATRGEWLVGDLPAAGLGRLTLRLRAGAVSTTTLRADLSAGTYDHATANNSLRATFTPTPVADLSLTLTSSSLTPTVGKNVVLTMRASNAGPSAAGGVTVRVNLPLGMTLVSQSVSVGEFDSVARSWSLGRLAKGRSATAKLTLRIDVEGSLVTTGTVAGAQDDPDPANNAASLNLAASKRSGLELDGIEVESEALGPGAVLAWAACDALPASAAQQQCLAQRRSSTAALLDSLQLRHTVVTDQASFRRALRCGDYGTYWLSGADIGQAPIGLELAAVSGWGGGLIVDQLANAQTLETLLGTQVVAEREGGGQVAVSGGNFAASGLRVTGRVQALEVTSALAEGRFDEGHGEAVALATKRSGLGRSVTAGFGWIDALAQPGQSETAQAQFREALGFVQPAAPLGYLPGERAEVLLQLANTGPATDVVLKLHLPQAAKLEFGPAEHYGLDGGYVVPRTLGEGETQQIRLGIRLPPNAGDHALRLSLSSRAAATGQPLEWQVELPVFAAEQWIAEINNKLREALATRPALSAAATSVHARLAEAGRLLAAGRLSEAEAALTDAFERLAGWSGVEADALRAGLGRLLQHVWRASCEVIGDAHAPWTAAGRWNTPAGGRSGASKGQE